MHSCGTSRAVTKSCFKPLEKDCMAAASLKTWSKSQAKIIWTAFFVRVDADAASSL